MPASVLARLAAAHFYVVCTARGSMCTTNTALLRSTLLHNHLLRCELVLLGLCGLCFSFLESACTVQGAAETHIVGLIAEGDAPEGWPCDGAWGPNANITDEIIERCAAVIGTLYKTGDTSPGWFSDAFAEAGQECNSENDWRDRFDMSDLLPDNLAHYEYLGSLVRFSVVTCCRGCAVGLAVAAARVAWRTMGTGAHIWHPGAVAFAVVATCTSVRLVFARALMCLA